MAVSFVVLTFAAYYLVEGVLVGALLGLIHIRTGIGVWERRTVISLLMAFATLDCLWLPAAAWMDLRVTIGNPDAATWIGLPANTAVSTLFTPGFFELTVWGIQLLIAISTANVLATGVVRVRTERTG
jgi:hypothetical protein